MRLSVSLEIWRPEASTGSVLSKKVSLEISQNSQDNNCARVSIKKDTLPQMFSCEFCEIKNTFYTEHLWSTVSRENWICKLPVSQSSTHQSLLIRGVQVKWGLENNLNYNNLNNLHDEK